MTSVLGQSFREATRRAARSKRARAVIIRLAALALLAAPALSACAEQRDKRPEDEGARAAASAAHDAINSPTAAPEASPKPTGSSAGGPAQSASAAPESMSLAGTWEGSYNAKKGSVELPAKVKDKARSRDDGATAVGPGTVTLTISPDGELSGKVTGALGDATLRGTVDGEMVRASVFPDNPTSPSAMTGVLVGMQKEGVIRAEIRVAGPDATIVRESPIELKRK